MRLYKTKKPVLNGPSKKRSNRRHLLRFELLEPRIVMTHSLGFNPMILGQSGDSVLGGFIPKAAAATGSPVGFGGGGAHLHSDHGGETHDSVTWIREQEQVGTHANDLPAGAQHLQNLGTRSDNVAEVSVLGTLGQRAREINAHEDDGSIPKANATGLVAGQNGSIIVRGKIGDGPHGSTGTGHGDYDYYKVSASAGQLISVNVEGQSLEKTLDSVAAIYSSSGELLTFNDNHMIYQSYKDFRPTFDPAFRFLAPSAGTYYVAVFSSFNLQSSPLDSSSGAGVYTEGDYNLSITTESPRRVTTVEENGAIPFATATGLQAGVDGFVYATGTIGDGLFGSQGTGTGDYDVFRVDAAAGQRIILAVDTDPTLHSLIYVDPLTGFYRAFGMDTIMTVYDEFGQIVVSHDDWDNLDSHADFLAPHAGPYYVAVSGGAFSASNAEYFANNYLANPFDPSSGGKAGTEGSYGLSIKTETTPDRDFYSVDLRRGDVLSVATVGGAGNVELFGPSGQLLHSTYVMENQGQSKDSLALVKFGEVGFIRVVTEEGRYRIAVADASPGTFNPNIAFQTPASPYELKVRVNRPALEQLPVYSHQVLFLDFDGAPSSSIYDLEWLTTEVNPVVETLSPFRNYLPAWGLSISDENEMIDRMIARVVEGIATDVGGVSGRGKNGEFLVTGHAGDFQIEILNSRDQPDYYRIYPNVSRMIIGASLVDELGYNQPNPFLGAAEHIDTGNFDLADTAFVFAKEMGDILNRLNVPIAPTATRLQFYSEWFAQVILHEAGHNFGSWHTNPRNATPDIMDNSLILSVRLSLGEDGIFGTADDRPFRFGVDSSFNEWYPASVNDTLNTIAFGLSTGTKSGTYFDFVTGTLYVTGNIDDGHKDELEVKAVGTNIKIYINDKLVLTRPAAGVNRVVLNGSSDKDELDASNYQGSVTLYGRGGNDELAGGSNNDLLFGGDGDDELSGNAGNDVLVGGDGDDELDGGIGSDVLIGGLGSDDLQGGGGGDLLIGTRTANDNNASALLAVVAEWSSSRSYADRIANLRGVGTGTRANGNTFLKTSGPQATIFEDAASDKLTGGSGRDWFFAKLSGNKKDKINNLDSNEWVDLLS